MTAALASFAQDPYLVENYAGIGVATFIAGNVFYLFFWKRDLTGERSGSFSYHLSDFAFRG